MPYGSISKTLTGTHSHPLVWKKLTQRISVSRQSKKIWQPFPVREGSAVELLTWSVGGSEKSVESRKRLIPILLLVALPQLQLHPESHPYYLDEGVQFLVRFLCSKQQ